MLPGRPNPDECVPWSAGYVNRVPEEDVLSVLRTQGEEFATYVRSLPEPQADYRYAEGKWSVRESLQHINDTERIFACRALRIARGDQTPLPGFEQNEYVPHTNQSLTLAQLSDEFESIRRSTVLLFQHLTEDAWTRTGIAGGQTASVRAYARLIAGHVRHHVALFETTYFPR